MITLTATTHIIEVTTSEATNIDVFCSYADHTSSGATLGDQQTLITTATTTTVVSAPASSTQRQIKTINIRNTSATTNIITVKKDVSTTEYDLFSCTLGGSEQLEYLDGRGWQVYTTTGAIKNSINQGSAPISTTMSATVLANDVANANAVANTIADVTGLSFAVTSGNTYWFRFSIWYTSAATTTGSRWSINGPANTLLTYRTSNGLSASGTAGTDVMTEINNAAFDTPAASNATSSTATAGQANMAIIEGIITPSADGTVIARFASEVTVSAITAKAGSVVFYQQVL